MISSTLINHDNVKNFIQVDGDVWHRVYSFAADTPDIPTLAHEIEQATGIKLMAETNQDPARGEVIPEILHGFITSARLPDGANGTCDWCLTDTEQGKQHSCIIITLYEEHVSEEAVLLETIARVLQEHKENIALNPQTTP